MSRLARRLARATFRPVSERELREVERDAGMSGDATPTKGFCHSCERFVDEAAGKLHRSTCDVAPERRRAS